MSSTITVQGQVASATGNLSPTLQKPDALVRVDLATAKSANLDASARDISVADISLGEWSDDALVELQLDQGVRVWMSVAELRESPQFNAAMNATDIRVGPTARGAQGERGLGDWIVKALTVTKKPIADFEHQKLVEKIEDGLHSAPGLYRIGSSPNDLSAYDPDKATEAQGPFLIFLHGTASSTLGSFGGLWQANGGAAIASLNQLYPAGRMLALQHRSLSENPIDNALVVARSLPKDAVLHLISHSRGGLIGELLARASASGVGAPFPENELVLFESAVKDNPAWKGAGRSLRELNALLAQKRFRIERFVRVACPALGTTLASGKLQKWCNIVMNVLGAASTLAGSAMGAAIANLLKGLIAGLITFDDLPGLQAMDPGGPLVKLLNGEDVQTDADLVIIGGITEGGGVWNRLKMLLVDAFFTGDNDLVVDTPSMSGGTRRVREALRYLHDATDINHFEYFNHPVTSRHLLDALSSTDRQNKGFESIAVTHRMRGFGANARGVKPLLSTPPIVFVLPGIMGSDLDVKGDRVWVDYGELFFTGLDRLNANNPDVTAIALDDDTYTGLINFLGQTHEVVPFPYDWRLALADAGKKLNDALRSKLSQIDAARQPIRIVAHSMGGLVARAMMLRDDSVWPELCKNPSARLLMMGTPNRGSHAITNLLLGQEHVLKLLCTVNIKQGMRGLLGIIKDYRGALDMMPWPSDRDYFDPAVWAKLVPIADVKNQGWPQADAAHLSASHEFCTALALQKFDSTRVFYVAGQADETPIGIDLDGVAPNQRIKFMVTTAGDGRVPWDTGIPAGISAWYVDAAHGDIPAHDKSYSGYLDILQTGTTNALRKDRPALARGADTVFEMRNIPVSYLPDADALRRAGIGGASSQQPSEANTAPKIPVRVSWGDLKYASHIVMVGHYKGDTIVSAEATLDARLGGELRRRHQLRVYPDRIGTALAVENVFAKPCGAIVIGLGDVGELSAGNLTRAVTYGISTWLVERTRSRADSALALDAAGVSILLIGSGGAALSIASAINAILRGITAALKLTKHVLVDTAVLSEIEFVELYEDRAHSLWHDLGALIEATDLKENYERRGTLTVLRDGRKRVCIDDAPDWWQRLQITQQGDRLLFNDMVARARSESRVLPTQKLLIERMLQKATQSTARDENFENALFELLIPNELKDAAPRRDNLLLVLDKDTARYPWELMTDPQDSSKLPQAVEAGGLRQFATTLFRENPAMVTSLDALVIGDPLGPFVELKGAQAEASAVASVLQGGGYKVKAFTDRPGTVDVMCALYQKPYRVVHLAGHGVPDISQFCALAKKAGVDSSSCAEENAGNCVKDRDGKNADANCSGAKRCRDDEKVSGMVLEDGAFLTYAEVGQMRNVPELVFVNCCHLGAITDEPNEIAAHFGQKFIEMGVRAIVAAGWAVDDAAAEYFAGRFYAQMLQGVSFGEAVKCARKACYDKFPDRNTWGAYQCYGDPDYRLVVRNDHFSPSGPAKEYASENELLIDGIDYALTGFVAGQKTDAIKLELERLLQIAAQSGFLGSGRIYEALAAASERIGDYENAIKYYEDAVTSDNGKPSLATLGAIERLANLRARQAIEDLSPAIWMFPGTQQVSVGKKTEARKKIATSIEAVQDLLKLGQTRERLVALGGSHKRLALLTGGAQRTTALKEMSRCYDAAAHYRGNTTDPYPVIQSAIAAILLNQLNDSSTTKGKGTKNTAGASSKAAQAAVAIDLLLANAAELQRLYLASNPPSIWTDCMQADLDLVGGIHGKALNPGAAKSIVDSYKRGLARANNTNAQKSIYENIGFIHALLSSAKNPPRAMLRIIEGIYRSLIA